MSIDAFFSRLNPLISLILRSPLHWLLSSGVTLITVERTLRRMPWLGRVFRVAYDKRTGLSDDQVKRLGEEIAVVRVRLAPR